MAAPDVRYADREGASIAWSALGDGPVDLLLILGGLSNLEHMWEEPGLARWFERLAAFSRLILMDRRGVGLSDPATGTMTLDDEAEDVLAVLDAAGSERAVLLAYAWGGPVAIHTAARRPERVYALLLYAAVATGRVATDDFGHSWEDTDREPEIAQTLAQWGTGAPLEQVAPSRAHDERLRAWMARLARLSSSPGAMRRLWESTNAYDARPDLPGLRVPTLILHRTGDRAVDVRHSRDLAERIPGARYVELPGEDNLPSVGDTEALVAEIEEFLTGSRRRSIERALLTIVVTDIVGSTTLAADLGDRAWRDLLATHHAIVRREIDRYDGQEVKSLGDGFLIAFGGAPSAAHRFALAITEAVRAASLEIRVGLHTGECEIIGDDVGGMAVHIAARIAELAGPGEIWASGTAFGTVVGSGLRFEMRGSEVLKGVPGDWPVMRLLG
jgi:pimeloyl-ACP methyl ester carboxylesterase